MSATQSPEQEPIVIHGPLSGADPLPTFEPAPTPKARQTVYLDGALAGPAPSPPPDPASEPLRADGLDAFRGLLLLAMNFAFTIPFGPFPAWMYHVQYPPPDGAFAEIAGLAWRDLLYAGFMFTMSAALPITMSARIAKRTPYPELVWTALRRGFLLYVFALVIGHVNPYWTHQYNKMGNVLSIAGFFVLFALFLRPRSDWSPVRAQWLRTAGWLSALAIFFLAPALYDASFSLARRDDIIASIGWAAVATTAIWLTTRRSVVARLGVLAVLLALRTAAQQAEWAAGIWYWTPARWLYDPWFAEMLFVAIPGTIAGDLLVAWLRRPREPEVAGGWSDRRLAMLALLGFSVTPLLLVGLWERQAVGVTTAGVFALSAAWLGLTRRPISERDRILGRLFGWAALWLVIGMLTEPLEGGVKKVPFTLSYLVLMAGFSCATLGSLLIVADHFKRGRTALRPLTTIGQNPLLAYVVLNLFLMHVLWLSGTATLFLDNWREALLRSLVITGAGAGMVWWASRRRLFWRA